MLRQSHRFVWRNAWRTCGERGVRAVLKPDAVRAASEAWCHPQIARRHFGDALAKGREGSRSLRRRLIFGSGCLLAVGCLDEGFRRCLEFWVVVFPLGVTTCGSTR
eukprot:Skav222342  [mRNA]  locus=scaffold3497:39362:41682:- [translate_table: standard]